MDLELATLRSDLNHGVAVVTIDHPPINLLDATMMVDPRSADPAPTELGFFHALLERLRTLPQIAGDAAVPSFVR